MKKEIDVWVWESDLNNTTIIKEVFTVSNYHGSVCRSIGDRKVKAKLIIDAPPRKKMLSEDEVRDAIKESHNYCLENYKGFYSIPETQERHLIEKLFGGEE